MIPIFGSHNVAKVFTDNIEISAQMQIKNLCDQEAFRGESICIMPDVHAGKGCTIGTTMTITDKVVPAMVGVDIGCGMLVVRLACKKEDIDLAEFDDFIRNNIPSGRNMHEKRQDNTKYYQEIERLKCVEFINKDRAYRSVGTLGGGNHFIELDCDEDGTVYLVIHTGSRNMGKQIAEYYQNKAVEEMLSGIDFDLNEKISALKSQGREKEIQTMLKADPASKIDASLCYLSGENMLDYLHDMEIAQSYADKNRLCIAIEIITRFKLAADGVFVTVHNYIDVEKKMLRKGAVSAEKGELLIIPINMRDGSLLCRGKGNKDWNYSAPHGAGRVMSRSEAKKRVTMEEFSASMSGIYSTSVTKDTIDESPMAYKPMQEIIDNIGDTVDIEKVIKPFYNFKAGE